MTLLLCILLMQIPYPDQPDWESIDSDYSTGGALVDVDLDGFIDFVTGNGNDMSQDPNRVYYNQGDSLERVASWSSSDPGYNAHISVTDINYDGYPDLAVANYGDPYAFQYDKFYYNQNGTYSATTSWHPHDFDNSFACAFGDMDQDGDCDLAVACGEEYGSTPQRAKVYLNTIGVLDTLASWESDLQSYFYDADWVDIDGDGDLDLALAGHHVPNVIYRNTNGMLETTTYWQSANSLGTLQMAFGDVDNDGDQDMVCANNAQTGGVSNCELYLNTGTTLAATPSWTSQNLQYYSCAALGDVDRDGDLDLAAGGWWESVKVFENDQGTYPTTPSWQWISSPSSHLVCENISFGDIDNTLPTAVLGEPHIVSPGHRTFYLENQWLISLDLVRSQTDTLQRNDYCFSFTEAWVSIGNVLGQEETLWVDYTYSRDLDLIVTNWHASRGNFLFLNTMGSKVGEVANVEPRFTIEFPNPNNGRFMVRSDIMDFRITVYDAMGCYVKQQTSSFVEIPSTGVYFMRICSGIDYVGTYKVVVVD
jgi:hypothetical protein